MNESTQRERSATYKAREAVAVFDNPDVLEAAVEKLGMAGVDRAAISVLGAETKDNERIARHYGSAEEAAHDTDAERGSFVSSESRAVAKTAAVTAPLYIASVAGAFAVAASGGTLALAAAAALGAGAAGGGLGALLAGLMERQHAQYVTEQIQQGGLVVWVSVPDEDAEKRVIEVLQAAGGKRVHIHESERRWGTEERPMTDIQPDPFLEKET